MLIECNVDADDDISLGNHDARRREKILEEET
jgi:hypothetical protein